MGFCEEPCLPVQNNKLKEGIWDTVATVTDNMLQTCGQGLNIIWISVMPPGMATNESTKVDRVKKKTLGVFLANAANLRSL
jgi:hypothetical protein